MQETKLTVDDFPVERWGIASESSCCCCHGVPGKEGCIRFEVLSYILHVPRVLADNGDGVRVWSNRETGL